MKQENAIELLNVSKTFKVEQDGLDTFKGWVFHLFRRNKKKSIKALSNVSFEIKKGETFGLIGRNGSGKSTLVKLMSGAIIPDKGGRIKKNGTSMLMNLGVGMSHELTAKENIYISGSTLGLRRREIDEIYEEILDFAELKAFENTKTKHFSSGMKQRLAFSIAINAGADIMFLDEVFAVGDAQFRQKAIKVFEENWIEGRTVIFVSHSMDNIAKYCSRTAYIKNGEIKFIGDAKEAIEHYKNDFIERNSNSTLADEILLIHEKLDVNLNKIDKYRSEIDRFNKLRELFKGKYELMIKNNALSIPEDAPLTTKSEEMRLKIRIKELEIAKLQSVQNNLKHQLSVLEKKSAEYSD